VIEWTRVRLSQWGRYCRGGSRTGYPTASAFVHADEGGRGSDDCSPMPPELQEVEDVVRRMSWSLAGPIHADYIWQGPRWFKCVKLGISLSTYKRRLRTSEEWIDRQLVIIAKPVDAEPQKSYKGPFSGYCVQR
jgi:hypothetical protein